MLELSPPFTEGGSGEALFPLWRLVDEEGRWTDERWADRFSPEWIEMAYRHMLRARRFDRKCLSLQRQGRIGTYAPYEGQEAAQVGSALALGPSDWLFPTYRDHAAAMTFGQPLGRILLYWKGRYEGGISNEGRKIFPPSVPIATQLPHAVGAAFAERFLNTPHVALVYFGDGATSEGDFHEALNLASVWNVPVVFFNQNNGYAISTPLDKQMKSKTIAQRALGYDLPGIRVDGNDVFAVYAATKAAVERARSGGGPALIEAVTWRYGAHTTADDPRRYRDQSESDRLREKSDPLLRVERILERLGRFDAEAKTRWLAAIDAEIEAAVREMESASPVSEADLFQHVFAESPDAPI
ncbi:MAG: Branched-chain alpha-keto acid dehydrogenase, E1 component, alpha subunit [Hydrogenibacillus schlegelii]|uniref:Pyruvate dehydrogenase E1 component subunit alpha n=1 Tax=Hydrogenibacillus schlegelii TaxID=1484 RepID=A0A2T5G811_HYDSH|nr:pyruvate dehydrogenase (acetyl-transferring) E1 component subunit alpha [Hydrogenibacillus schlegelii]PTQ52317.1 MAG: Branched-chain alpha-keto acid dehydrogenase, E1 component, alpha subunit [Hydrogenibacillus schlegelii]